MKDKIVFTKARHLLVSEKEDEWLEGLTLMSTNPDTFGPTETVCSLVQMGVCDPEDETTNEQSAEAQRDWNNRVHRAVLSNPNLRQKLRRVLRDDIAEAMKVDKFPDCDRGFWGPITNVPYARDLLDHFLSAKPDWI